jgi:hypothetical protein
MSTNGPVYNLFSCPHCDGVLNPGNGPIIKMKGRLEGSGFSVITDVFLPSGLGVYGRLTADHVVLHEGAKIQFSCPQCKAPFSETEEDELAQVQMTDAEDRNYLVSFNKRYGKRSTFVIDPQARKVEREFGDDAEDFRGSIDKKLNFFGS